MSSTKETSALSALTVEDRDIWSRFNDADGFYGGALRRASRSLDQSDASAMLHYTTNGELGSLPSSNKGGEP